MTMTRPMTFEEWIFQVEALFVERLDRNASTSGWDWEGLFRDEAMSPEEAVQDYIDTL